MQLLNMLQDTYNIDTNSHEWKSTLMQVKIYLKIDPQTIECVDSVACRFSQSDILYSELISERDVYAFGTEKGLLLLGPSTTELPFVAVIPKKEIKSIESRSKFTKMIVTIKTESVIYDFKTAKKDGPRLEKMVNKLRNY